MTRSEHLQWAKERAPDYTERNDLMGAITSFTSHLLKHEGTSGMMANEFVKPVCGQALHDARMGNANAIRKFIKGFG